MTDKLQPTTRAERERWLHEHEVSRWKWGEVVPDYERIPRLIADLERSNALLRRLHDAAETYSALQDGATDQRVGLVQPITVAEGNELLAALTEAAKHLEGD